MQKNLKISIDKCVKVWYNWVNLNGGDSMNSMICPYCGKLIAYNSFFDAFYCSKCGGFFKQATVMERNDLNEPVTNAQKIRSMSDEELAEFLWNFNLADVSTDKLGEFGPHMFRYRLKEWLKMPAKEDKHEAD